MSVLFFFKLPYFYTNVHDSRPNELLQKSQSLGYSGLHRPRVHREKVSDGGPGPLQEGSRWHFKCGHPVPFLPSIFAQKVLMFLFVCPGEWDDMIASSSETSLAQKHLRHRAHTCPLDPRVPTQLRLQASSVFMAFCLNPCVR